MQHRSQQFMMSFEFVIVFMSDGFLEATKVCRQLVLEVAVASSPWPPVYFMLPLLQPIAKPNT